MRTFLAFTGLVFVLAGAARSAEARQIKFVGLHPVPAAAGGGFCHIEAPHVHAYQPHKAKVLYRIHDGHYYFAGDPVAHGYQGDKHAYYGHHPIAVEASLGGYEPDRQVEYCYLDGPHSHYYAPPFSASFVARGGVYFYTGDYPDEYRAERPALVEINAHYKPLRYDRPVYVDAPPPEYHGPVLVVGAPAVVVETPTVVVERPVRAGVEVVVPTPALHVEVGLPSLVIGAGVHHHHDVVVVERHHHKKYKHGKYKHKKWKGHHRRGHRRR